MALEAEIQELKQQKQNKNNIETKTYKESNSTSEDSATTKHPKNMQETS